MPQAPGKNAPARPAPLIGDRDASGRFLPRRPQRIFKPAPPVGENTKESPPPAEKTRALTQSVEDARGESDVDESDDAEDDRIYLASQMKTKKHIRFSTGSPAFDHFLGGGPVEGFCYLFAGPPGGGKSTQLRMRIAAISAILGRFVMIACGEEDKDEVLLGLEESGIFERYPTARENVAFYESNDPEKILARADQIGAKAILIDSWGVSQSEFSSPGDGEQFKHAAKVCFQRAQTMGREHRGKEKITIFAIGHTNQDGTMSGPNKALHWVSFCSMIEHVDPVTLFPVDDQTRSTGTTGWRVYKGKSRGSSSLRQAFFDRDDLTGVVQERPAGTLPILGRLADDAAPRTAASKKVEGTKKAPPAAENSLEFSENSPAQAPSKAE